MLVLFPVLFALFCNCRVGGNIGILLLTGVAT